MIAHGMIGEGGAHDRGWDLVIRPSACAAVLAAALWVAGARHHALVNEADRARFSTACGEYHTTTGEMAEGAAAFGAQLAAACDAAWAQLDTGQRPRRIAAARLLARIARLQETVSAMNADRSARGGAPVTGTGEFLIAHRLGVVNAVEQWLDTGAGISLASHP